MVKCTTENSLEALPGNDAPQKNSHGNPQLSGNPHSQFQPFFAGSVPMFAGSKFWLVHPFIPHDLLCQLKKS